MEEGGRGWMREGEGGKKKRVGEGGGGWEKLEEDGHIGPSPIFAYVLDCQNGGRKHADVFVINMG